jgi:two-component system chemotaxis response regulator CheY
MSYCLVVEDNLVSCLVFTEHLEALGMESKVAHHANDALEKCKDKMPAVVILDWHMPDIDGLQFARMLRELPGGDAPRILVCSCDNGVQQQPIVDGLNVTEFLPKPTYLLDIFNAMNKLGFVEPSDLSEISLKVLEKRQR